jgi:hypothetical protein
MQRRVAVTPFPHPDRADARTTGLLDDLEPPGVAQPPAMDPGQRVPFDRAAELAHDVRVGFERFGEREIGIRVGVQLHRRKARSPAPERVS